MRICFQSSLITLPILYIHPSLLFLDAVFETFLHLTAFPLGVRLKLATPILLLLTQLPHLHSHTHTQAKVCLAAHTQKKARHLKKNTESILMEEPP